MLVLIFPILFRVGGIVLFFFTILFICLGWCLAGVVNIFGAKFFGEKILKKFPNPDLKVVGRPFTTWFPVFRANYEVAQIAEGGEPWKVLWSSIKVKLVTMLSVAIIPFLRMLIKSATKEAR